MSVYSKSMQFDRRDLGLLVLLFALALAVRLIVAAQLAFPPLDDPAFYVQTARNLAAGRGLVIDAIWSYFAPFTSVTHPSHEYWMPLATGLIAPSLRIFGDTLWAAQLPGLICGALLAPITYMLGRLAWPAEHDRLWAIAAGSFLVAGALPVYQSASTDSAAPFALFASLALLTGSLAVERRSLRWSVASGLCSGLAYLARSDGLLIPLMLAVWLSWLSMRRHLRWSQVLGLVGAMIVGVAPWWLRNLTTFGSTQPISPTLLMTLTDYGQLFNYQSLPSLERLLTQGAAFIVDQRAQALRHNLEVWLVISFPFGLFGLLSLPMARRPVLRVGLIYGLTLVVTTAIVFSVPTLLGLFYHSAVATLPWLAVGSVLTVRRLAKYWTAAGLALYLAMIGLILFQSTLAWPSVIADSRSNAVRFEAVTQWLRSNVPPDQPIITNEAHSLNYASGYPTLTLPNQQDVSIVRQLADRYGARFVVVFGIIGQYPAALDQTVRVVRRASLGDVQVYEIQP